MKSHLELKEDNLNYLILYLALLQSKVFWTCSVLYHVFKKSEFIIHKSQQTTIKRITDCPPVINKKRTTSDSNIISITEKKTFKEEKEEESTTEQDMSLTLPNTSPIRHRPTIEDERNGTTCPPVWWQKTQVKLRRTRISKSNTTTSTSTTTTTTLSNLNKKQNQRASTYPLLTVFSTKSSSSSSSSPSSSSIHTFNEEHIPFSKYTATIENISDHQQKKNIKKLVTKLNIALHNIPRHRKTSLSDLKKKKSLFF
ncbi:uncharacterized protein BX663DRAFT_300507 [Cokeromyces recurvatus]|uniref:uncharacterized protein n=1 Tax=Cokeromyces recurvatus TaxID=90255 RepID=UPI00222006FE|nr:uncharacterized protein BX663DRAFT_300507 [Cokeromyces recurvatus]KAI7897616.1 hypothetical protein BX663DRAFT_300507 [Cokeromyces recurvatus]